MTRIVDLASLRATAADPGAPPGKCCGQHAPDWTGRPYVLACQLCPKSPTYWRRGDGTSPAGPPVKGSGNDSRNPCEQARPEVVLETGAHKTVADTIRKDRRADPRHE